MAHELLELDSRWLHLCAVAAALLLPIGTLSACADGDAARQPISTTSRPTTDSDDSAQERITASSAATTADTANESGCEHFDPRSEPLDVGERVLVEVQIVDGRWSELDLAGNYWTTDEVVPPGASRNGVLDGTATVVEAEVDDTGFIRSGRVEVDFGEVGQVVFDGPIFCD